MDAWWFWPVLIGLMALSAVFSGSEIGIYGLNRVKLRYRLSQQQRSARFERPGESFATGYYYHSDW